MDEPLPNRLLLGPRDRLLQAFKFQVFHELCSVSSNLVVWAIGSATVVSRFRGLAGWPLKFILFCICSSGPRVARAPAPAYGWAPLGRGGGFWRLPARAIPRPLESPTAPSLLRPQPL